MLKKSNQKGFSIIEVLIVLAIAGLIMLIVFLAVPALQRNTRNTQRKNDVTALIGALQEYVSNNNGTLPATAAASPDFAKNAKLNIIEQADVKFTNRTAALTAIPTYVAGDENKVQINNYTKCAGNAFAATADSVSKRNVTAVYYVETTGTPQVQCLDM